MTGQPMHYGEELQDLLDGRLTESQRSQVERHVEHCVRCRRELEALRWVKSDVPKHVSEAEVPAELVTRVRASLVSADQPQRAAESQVPRRAWVVGALAAAALVLFLLRPERSPLSAVVADFQAHRAGTARLGIESPNPQVLEEYFIQNGIRFPTRVFDLGMMEYRLVGARVHRLNGRTSALFAYRGPGDAGLVCQMYEGNVSDLPATGDSRVHNGITFYVHRSEDLTVVFWQEGDVVCVLTSDAPAEQVVQLAFAKAVRIEAPAVRG